MEAKTVYHCCGNRHCPNCGTGKRDDWVEDRMSELLPTAYYHVVFTLPHELNPLVMGNRKILFNALFASASQTLLNHGKNEGFLGAEIGIVMVLHTWGQDLSFHPHVHCIVTGGGYDGSGWQQPKRSNNRFLFPNQSLAKMYKAMFMKTLEEKYRIEMGRNKSGQFSENYPLQTLEGVLQSSVWWTGTGGGISGKIYPQNSHHQTPHYRDD